MAGGPLAQNVTCLVCMDEGKLTKAARTREGDEDDQYQCPQGHTFGMDFRRGPLEEPMWPPPAELAARLTST